MPIVDRPLTKNKAEVSLSNNVDMAKCPDLPMNIVASLPCAQTRVQVPTVSLSAFAYLFSEYIQYLVDRANSISDLEER